MAGSATVTAVSSMNAMLDPRMVAASTHGAALGAQGALASFERMTPWSQGCLITLAIGTYTSPHVAEAESRPDAPAFPAYTSTPSPSSGYPSLSHSSRPAS